MSETSYTSKRDYSQTFKTKAENAIRRSLSMDLKVFEVKIQINKCDITQKTFLSNVFLEAKWYYNDCLNFGLTEGKKPYKNDYTKKTVIHYDKDKNPIESEFQFLGTASKQEINKRIGSNCKSIKTNLKNKNIKTSHGLKFKSEINSIPFREFGNSWKFKGTKIKLAKCSKPFKINGLEQLQIDGIEFANANLIQRPSGYYIQITCYIPKEQPKESNHMIAGLDLGCMDTVVGYIEEIDKSFKLNYCFEQSERQIRTQRKLSRRQSKNLSNRTNKGLRLTKQNRKYFEHLNNQKKDAANKFVYDMKEFDRVIIQDEMLALWQKTGHGKKINTGILGKLKTLLKKLPNVFVLDKTLPTSKFCFDCFHKNDSLKLWNREFICPYCGSKSDRDVHAAKNMIAFYHLIQMVPTEIHRDPKRLRKFVLELLSDIEKRVENNSSESIEESVFYCIQELSEKHEAESLLDSQ